MPQINFLNNFDNTNFDDRLSIQESEYQSLPKNRSLAETSFKVTND